MKPKEKSVPDMNVSEFRDQAIAFLEKNYPKWFSPNHQWSKPQIQIFYDNEVWFVQYCPLCGSRRIKYISYESYMISRFRSQIKFYWRIHDGKIKHPKNYKDSICLSRYILRHPERFKRQEIREFEERKLREERNRFDKKRRFRDKQIDLNVKIVMQYSGQYLKRKSMARLRRDLAVYRLNRYCDLSDKQIAEKVGLSIGIVGRIVGSTFRLLCMSDESCVYRNIFLDLDNTEKRNVEPTILPTDPLERPTFSAICLSEKSQYRFKR